MLSEESLITELSAQNPLRSYSRLSAALSLALSSFVLLYGCGGDSPTAPGGPVQITSSGGTVTNKDTSVQLAIPPGALGTPTTISITALDATALPVDAARVGTTGFDIGPSGTTFSAPATLTVRLPAGALAATPDGEITVATLNGTTPVDVPSVVSSTGTTITAPITHLSPYWLRLPQATGVRVTTVAPKIFATGSMVLAAVALSDVGHTIKRTIAWSSGQPAIATVASDGTVTGVAAGTVFLYAQSGIGRDSVLLTVVPRRAATITITPSAIARHIGESAGLAPVLRDSVGAILTDRTITWTSSDPHTVSVSSSGFATMQALGSATINAVVDDARATVLVTVIAVPLGAVTISPQPGRVFEAGSATFTAVLHDSAGTALAGHTFTWATSDPTIATVDDNGSVHGVVLGTVTITATSEGGRTGSEVVTVVPRNPHSIAILMATPEIVVSPTYAVPQMTFPLTAIVYDSASNVLNVTPTWASSDPTIATITSDPVVTAVAVGATAITATVGTVVGTDSLFVGNPLTVLGLVDSNNGAIDANHVAGVIAVKARAITLLPGGSQLSFSMVCGGVSADFGATSLTGPTVTINDFTTATFDTQHAAAFPNGPCQITAKAVRVRDNVLFTTVFPFTLTNP